MPSTDTPIVGLGGALLSLLLATLAAVALVALTIGAGVWIFAAQDRPLVSRSRAALFGSPTHRVEPRARLFLRVAFGLLWIADGLLQAQPKMPAGFVADVLGPGVAGGPGWFDDLVAPVARAWTRHPVAADVATVWIQVGIGLLILVGGSGWLAKVALWGSILWSAVVWSIGEAFGGLLAAGASWLSGAPGAVLVYAAASGLLLVPWDWWDSGRAPTIARRFAAVWLSLGAVLQALPGERQWSAGIADMFVDGARRSQPGPLVRPIARLASLATNDAAALNAVIIVVLVSVATALWFTGRAAVIVAAIVLCAATWWLAQDFGVLGGTATDPNAALPLGLLLATALPGWSRATRSAAAPAPAAASRRVRTSLGAGVVTLAVGLGLVVPAILTSTLGRPADAVAVAADSSGGWRRIPPRPAPAFALTDQRGKPVSSASLRGKLVLLTFLDPVCTSDCPLIANQIAVADRELGSLAQRVEFVAVDSNPIFHYVADVNAFTESHGLGTLSNWHFLCGASDTVQGVLADYGISVDVPAVGMIQHSEGMYVITADGREAAYLDDGAGTQLTGTYADQLRDEIRKLLK